MALLSLKTDQAPTGELYEVPTASNSVLRVALVPDAPLSSVFWVDAATSTPEAGQNGQIGSPFADLQLAVDAVPPGSTLMLAPGSYGDVVTDKPITLRGTGGTADAVMLGEVDLVGVLGTSTLELVTAGSLNVSSGAAGPASIYVRASTVESVDTSGEDSPVYVFFEGWGSPFGGSVNAARSNGLINLGAAAGGTLCALNARFDGTILADSIPVEFNGCLVNDNVFASSIKLRNSYVDGSLNHSGTPGSIAIDDSTWNTAIFGVTGFDFIQHFGSARALRGVGVTDFTIPAVASGAIAMISRVVPEFADDRIGGSPVGFLATWGAVPPQTLSLLGCWRSNDATGQITVRFGATAPGYPGGTELLCLTLLQRGAF